MKNNTIKVLLSSIFVILVIIVSVILFYPNVRPFEGKKYFYVRKGYTLADVDRELVKQRIIKRRGMWSWAEKITGFDDDDIKPGRYEIKERTNSYSIIHRISNNIETPTNFDFTYTKTPPQFTDMFYQNTECLEEEVEDYFFNPQRYQQWDYDSMSLLAVFFREKFESKWSYEFESIAEQMHNYYLEYWSDKSRQQKLQNLGVSQKQAMILCSIVQGEIMHDSEAGTVAQVYLNRLHKNMKLQADPTVIYSIGDFSKNRVSHEDLKVNSPFNTYMHTGLPPGPIQTVRESILDSILVSTPNDYLYFCADPDRKGYHRFTSNYDEHLSNAQDYHQYLDSKNIH